MPHPTETCLRRASFVRRLTRPKHAFEELRSFDASPGRDMPSKKFVRSFVRCLTRPNHAFEGVRSFDASPDRTFLVCARSPKTNTHGWKYDRTNYLTDSSTLEGAQPVRKKRLDQNVQHLECGMARRGTEPPRRGDASYDRGT